MERSHRNITIYIIWKTGLSQDGRIPSIASCSLGRERVDPAAGLGKYVVGARTSHHSWVSFEIIWWP